MKKLGLVTIITIMAIGTVSAQNWENLQTTSVSGTLQLQDGLIAVASGDNIYFVPLLRQYIGFIEGLREGEQISVSGFVTGNFIQPTNVILAGRTYVFPPNMHMSMQPGLMCSGDGSGMMGSDCPFRNSPRRGRR